MNCFLFLFLEILRKILRIIRVRIQLWKCNPLCFGVLCIYKSKLWFASYCFPSFTFWIISSLLWQLITLFICFSHFPPFFPCLLQFSWSDICTDFSCWSPLFPCGFWGVFDGVISASMPDGNLEYNNLLDASEKVCDVLVSLTKIVLVLFSNLDTFSVAC